MCSGTSSDLMGTIEIILSIIPRELTKGNIVEPGDLGSSGYGSIQKGSRPQKR